MELRDLLDSDEPIACVLQGGGLRGTYGIAALAELERMGYTNRFSAIYGSSAGALNGAYFLAGQAAAGVRIYVDHLSNKRFVNLARLDRVLDIDYLVDTVLTHRVPLDQEAVRDSRTPLYVYVTDAMTGDPQRFLAQDRSVPLMEMLRATAAMPIAFGREIMINGRKYADGGMKQPIPLMPALEEGHRNVLVILTRPLVYRSKPPGALARFLMQAAARMHGHSPNILRALGEPRGDYVRTMQILRGAESVAPAKVWVIAPDSTRSMAGRLTTDKDMLQRTADLAVKDVAVAMLAHPAGDSGNACSVVAGPLPSADSI